MNINSLTSKFGRKKIFFPVSIWTKKIIHADDFEKVIGLFTNYFFKDFINTFLDQSGYEGTSLIQEKERYMGDYTQRIWVEILSRVKISSNTPNIAFTEYIKKNNLIDDSEDFIDFIQLWLEKESYQNILIQDNQYSFLIELILGAIQQLIYGIPYLYYDEKYKISFKTEERLFALLEKIDSIQSANPQWQIQKGQESDQILRQNIARRSKSIWLPLKPLISAPLSSIDDMQYYSTTNDLANKLAKHIIFSEGVILVTGYRGVGKTSLINATLVKYIDKARKSVRGNESWEIIDVHINVAKEDAIKNVLRLCIRALYHKFYELEHTEENKTYLNRDERNFLELANLCASYHVNLSQSSDKFRAAEAKASWGINPADVFPRIPIGSILGFLPTLSGKVRKGWNEKLSQTISLIDYDENRAEEDIEKFIRMITIDREGSGKKKIKLVIVFDELDKMELAAQENILKKLKNLFLTRHSIFIIITSKDFYYRWIKSRSMEDSILGSYFGSIIIVPVFSSKDTKILIDNLISSTSTNEEKVAIDSLSKYLSYKACGIPRDIIREIQEIARWTDKSQPYLTDKITGIPNIQVYVKIQEAIEKLCEVELSLIGSERTDSTPSTHSSINGEEIWEKVLAEDSFKRFLSNAGSRDQVMRGLNLYMEQLIDQKIFTFSEDNIKTTCDNLFNTIPYEGCKSLLATFSILLERDCVIKEGDKQIQLFKIQEPEKGNVDIVVQKAFYNLSGRHMIKEDMEVTLQVDEVSTTEDILGQIKSLLSNTEDTQKISLALGLLGKFLKINETEKKQIPNEIQKQLYKLFISPENSEDHRLRAARGVGKDIFYSELESYPANYMMSKEVNEKILLIFLDMFSSGLQEDKREFATEQILQFLKLHKENNAPLSKNTIVKVVTTLFVVIPDTEEKRDGIIDQILIHLAPSEPLSSSFIKDVLYPLCKKTHVDLIKILLDKDFTVVQDQDLSELIREYTEEDRLSLWENVIHNKGKLLSPIIMKSILLNLKPNGDFSDFLAWLNASDWDKTDKEVLEKVSEGDPNIIYLLKRELDKAQAAEMILARERVNDILTRIKTSLDAPLIPDKIKTLSSGKKITRVILMLISLVALVAGTVIFTIIPNDLSPNITLKIRLISRVLELTYFIFGVCSFVLGIWGITDIKLHKKKMVWAGVFLALGGICVAVLMMVLQQPITLLGQLTLFGIFLATIIISFLSFSFSLF